jgi:replicative DNA helicase
VTEEPPEPSVEPDDNDRQYGRVPPQDVEAERSVLGAMLISEQAIASVLETGLVGPDFYRPSHEQIWDAVLDLYTRSEPADMVTVSDVLRKADLLQKVGGAPYLHTLANTVGIAANADYHARIVRECAIKRRLVDAGTRIVQYGYSTGELEATLDAAQVVLLDAMPATGSEDIVRADVFATEVLDHIEQLGNGANERAVPTGFYDLDDLTGGGFLDGQMVVVAGRPAMGKSTLATDFLRAAAIRRELPSVIFSLEMTRQEIAMRLVAAEAKVPLRNLRAGQVDDDQWGKIALALNPIARSPLWVDDSSNLTMTAIRAKARRLNQQIGGEGLRLIVIDYLQLMTSGARVESRQLEVSEFSRQIKLLAKELACPIVALSQLNRGPEQRSNKRPMLSDLRESGSIEQDSDVVILMHREDYYDEESTRPGEADLIVAKHRNGPTRDIAVAAQLHYARFADLAH